MALTPPSPSPLKLTPEITEFVNGALTGGNALVLAAVDQKQHPIVSFRGSTAVYGPDQLSFWARNNQGGTLEAIKHNPAVAFIYRSPTVPMLQFYGRARIANNAAEREKVYGLAHEMERAQDPEKKGTAVVVDLDRVFGVIGFGNDGPIWCVMERR